MDETTTLTIVDEWRTEIRYYIILKVNERKREKVVALLREFGAKRLDKLSRLQYPQFLKRLKAL